MTTKETFDRVIKLHNDGIIYFDEAVDALICRILSVNLQEVAEIGSYIPVGFVTGVISKAESILANKGLHLSHSSGTPLTNEEISSKKAIEIEKLNLIISILSEP